MESVKKLWQNFGDLLESSPLPSPLKNRYIVLSAVAVVILVIILFSGSSAVVKEIPLYEVKRGNFTASLTESGEIRARNSTSISSPRIRGNLKIVYLIPEGTYVQKGDTVARFDPTEAKTQLQSAISEYEIALSEKDKMIANHKSTLGQADMTLKNAELSFELSKLNLEQMKFEAEAKQEEAKLQHEKNRLSYLQTQNEFESKKIIQKSELNKMDLEIRQKKNEVDKRSREVEMMTLTAPEGGLVVYGVNWSNQGRKFSVGDTPWGGQTIMTLPDLSEMESTTQVNEVDVSKVKVGQKVLVKLDAFRDSSFVGKVSEVANLGKNKDGDAQVKVFEVIVEIINKSAILKPGMTTGNKIVMNEIEDVLSVPIEAVFERNDKKIVYVKNGSGFDETEVTIGDKSEDFIIIDSGLEQGEEVALLNPNDVEEEETGNSNEMPGS